jgi:predicted amidohydrolase YtcJ
MQIFTNGVRALFLLFLLFPQTPAANQAEPADTILVNGKFITVDSKDSIAEAVAIRDGKILAVGAKDAVMRHAASSTQIIDLHGRTATPGLIDAHLHFAEIGPLYSIDLSHVRNIAEVLKAVRDRAATTKPGEWIQGNGWDEGKLAEHRYIFASDLDQAAPQNPVWLVHTTGHYGVANSVALKLAHISAETKDPEAGIIDRDAKNQPTGVLKEEPAMQFVTALIPPYSREQMRDGYLKMMAGLNREGMTAIKDPGITGENWDIYRELHDQNKFTIHLFTLWLGGTKLEQTRQVLDRILTLPKPRSAEADDLLISGGVKLFMDGSAGARTAWVYDDWNKNSTGTDTGNRGYPATDPEIYRQQIRMIHEAGIHVSTHAVGDRAIDWVVDTYAQVLKDKPTSGLRHGIIHGNIPTDHAIATMAALEKQFDAGYPESQGEFMWWIGDTYAANFGPARALRLMPFHTYLTRGIPWAGGSDYYVTPFAARYGIWATVVRRTLSGTYGAQPFGTAEVVDIHAALRSYTIWAAHQLFLEDRIGSLEVGKEADIAVWDRDMYSIPSDGLKDIKCELTLFKGRAVYIDPSSPVKPQLRGGAHTASKP